jgi:antibiotic biosynthesis monooxygenase (ABM) superfamily enzyme
MDADEPRSPPHQATEADPVTVVVSRRARPGSEAAMEDWLRGVSAAAVRFPGHLGVEVFRPHPPDQPDHVLVFRFDTPAHLKAWTTSAVRREWLARAEPITEGPARGQVVTGLETWFTLPGRQPAAPPPRWKMALVTGSVIYLLVNALTLTITPRLATLPLAVRSLVIVAIIVSLMTWVVMPQITRLLGHWLYQGQDS